MIHDKLSCPPHLCFRKIPDSKGVYRHPVLSQLSSFPDGCFIDLSVESSCRTVDIDESQLKLLPSCRKGRTRHTLLISKPPGNFKNTLLCFLRNPPAVIQHPVHRSSGNTHFLCDVLNRNNHFIIGIQSVIRHH